VTKKFHTPPPIQHILRTMKRSLQTAIFHSPTFFGSHTTKVSIVRPLMCKASFSTYNVIEKFRIRPHAVNTVDGEENIEEITENYKGDKFAGFKTRSWNLQPSADYDFPGRLSATLTSIGSNLYLIGGETELNRSTDPDVHRFDMKTRSWTRLVSGGDIPTPRFGHSATVWDDHGILVFGGTDARGDSSELFLYDPAATCWNLVKTKGYSPSPRSLHNAFISQGQYFVFGGSSTFLDGRPAALNDLFRLDLKNFNWIQIQPKGLIVPVRWGAGGCTRGHFERLIIQGGFNGKKHLYDMYEYNLWYNEWKQIPVFAGSVKPTRSTHCLLSYGKHLFAYGGEIHPPTNGPGRYANDALAFNFENREWEEVVPIGVRPSQRGGVAADRVGDNQFAAFGGFDGSKRWNDLYIFDM